MKTIKAEVETKNQKAEVKRMAVFAQKLSEKTAKEKKEVK